MVSRSTLVFTASRTTDFVVTAAQLEALGVSIWAANRRVASGEWQRLERGIFLTHPLSISWRARARLALLIGGRTAFLTHEAAWFMHDMTSRPPEIITVGIQKYRRISERRDMIFQRRPSGLLISGSIPMTVLEETVLDLSDDGLDALAIIGLLSDAFRKGLNRNRLLFALGNRRNYSNRTLFLRLLGEVVNGVESPLEFSYDQDVEQAHGLPRSRRQGPLKISGGWIRSDRIFDAFRLRLELDGQIAHPGGRTDRDTWRDNAVLIKTGDATLRYRWPHIIGTPCETAGQITEALKQRGWAGEPKKCGPDCTIFEYRP